MTVQFTRQDLYTFLIGLAVALAFTLGEGLVNSQEFQNDPTKWAIGLGSALMTSAGRYILTELTQRASESTRPKRRRKEPRET